MSVQYQRVLHDSLVASAETHSGKLAVEADDGSVTFAELLARSLSLAAALQEEGIERGDRVVLFMENSLAYATAVFGVLFAGGTFVNVNPQTKEDHLSFILDDCVAKAVLGEGPTAQVAVHAREVASTKPKLVVAGDDAGGDLLDLATMVSGQNEPRPSGVIPTDLAALLYTSGSTGTPKGVMLTHQNLLFVIESIAEYLRLDSDDRILNVLPLAFGYGMSQLLLTARLGATLYLERSFAFPARTLQQIEKNEVTVLPGIPTVYATLASRFADAGTAYPSVKCITNAAAGLPPALHEPLGRLFPNALIFRMYGLTECIRVCYLEPELVEQKPTSVGKAIPGTEAAVLDDDGNPVKPGEVGTLYVRGPHVMAGYWQSPELTAGMITAQHTGDRLLCTQDLFTTDEDGDLYFVSRSDEIIKTRGEKVSPIHVENVLFAVDGIREAAVIGVPDELLGEAIHAYVVREEGSRIEAPEIVRACREKLEAFAVPHEVTFIEALPKTASGKVRRKSLRT